MITYVQVLDVLEAGDIVEIQTNDAQEMKGRRITLSRKASSRGFNVEYRTVGNTLNVKKSEASATPAKPRKQKVTA